MSGSSGFLTIAEIARALSLPESTVRYYRDRFAGYVPSQGQGRSRRYEPAALDVLRSIADAMRSNVPQEEIEQRLAASYPLTVDTDESITRPQQQSAATQQQSAAAFASLVGQAVEHAVAPLERELEATRAALMGKDATIERQAEELGAARERARQAEERAAQLERAVRRQQRPWWLRLLG